MIEIALEEKQICSAQAFDKVWNEELKCCLGNIQKFSSQISDRLFSIKEKVHSNLYKKYKLEFYKVVFLHLSCIYYIPTFADDTAILTTGQDEIILARLLQKTSRKIYNWINKLKIKLNEDKSVHINLTNKGLNNPDN